MGDIRQIGGRRMKRLKRVLLYTILLGAVFASLVPFYWLVRSSFMEIGQIFLLPPKWIPDPFTLENYVQAFQQLPLMKYFLNTVEIILWCLAGTLFTSSLCAYGFSRIQWPGRDVIFTVLLSSMMLPGAVTMIPTFIGWTSAGFSNSIVPLAVPSWLGGGIFNIFLLKQFFAGIPKDLDESARLDGASHIMIYSKIILPLCKPALSVVGLFTFMNVWNDVMGPLLYLNDEEKFTLALGLKQFISLYTSQWGLLMAASTAAVIPVIIVYAFGQRYFIEGIVMTGIKG